MYGVLYNERGQLKLYSAIVASSFSIPCNERLILLFILQRTVGWRKQFAKISEKEFETGVYRRRAGERHLIVGGTGLTAGQINHAIGVLRKMGAVETAELNGKTAYRIFEDWRHPDLASGGGYNIWGIGEPRLRLSRRR